MARCVMGLGGPNSSAWPFLRRHVGRAFVEHVAEAQALDSYSNRYTYNSYYY